MKIDPVGNVDGKDPAGFRRAAKYLGLGSQLAAAIAGFGFVGHWIDSSVGTGSLWTTIMLFLGCIGGMVSFIRTVNRLNKESKDDRDDEAGKVS